MIATGHWCKRQSKSKTFVDNIFQWWETEGTSNGGCSSVAMLKESTTFLIFNNYYTDSKMIKKEISLQNYFNVSILYISQDKGEINC